MRLNLFIFLFLLSLNAIGQDHHRLDSLNKQLAAYADSIPSFRNKVDISVSNTSLKEFLRAVAETHDLNLSLERIPEYRITNNFENVTVEGLIAFVCYSYHLDVRVLNNIVILYPHSKPDYVSFEYEPERDLLSFHLVKDTLKHVAKEISDSTHYNLVLSQNVRERTVHGFIEHLPFREAMKQLAASNDLVIEETSKDVFFVTALEPEPIVEVEQGRTTSATQRTTSRRTSRRTSSSGSSSSSSSSDIEIKPNARDKTKIDVSAEGTDILEAIRYVCNEQEIPYFFLEEPKGKLDCHLIGVSIEDFLEISLVTAQPAFSYTIKNGVYVIGGSKNSGMHDATVFTFKNRSVEKAQEKIPAALKENLEIMEYPDLNALIITGSDQNTRRLINFLKQIDKSVANVLIEVMVVVVNKGASLDAGLSAGITDSTSSPTSGSVLPGIDMQLNAQSLNRFLGAIDRRGIINLGRVTPNFYASIEALERDNFLDMQSTPKLSTLNGHEANLVIGNSVYYLIETQNVTGGVNPIITRTPRYEKVEANLDLTITPFVSYNEDVTLTIEFESSDFIDPTIDGAPPGNSTRRFDSKIRIKNEEMIVVGGLESESNSQTISSLPGIARVPVLKWFFGNNSKSRSQNKLLVFIKPTIVY